MSQMDPNVPPENQPPPPPVPPAEPAPAVPGEPDKNARSWAMGCHLIGLLGLTGLFGVVGALVFWLVKRDDSSFIDRHGKESLNFQITLLIAYIISVILTPVVIGCFLYAAVYVVNVVFCIIAGLKANEGVEYRYPICIRFIK